MLYPRTNKFTELVPIGSTAAICLSCISREWLFKRQGAGMQYPAQLSTCSSSGSSDSTSTQESALQRNGLEDTHVLQETEYSLRPGKGLLETPATYLGPGFLSKHEPASAPSAGARHRKRAGSAAHTRRGALLEGRPLVELRKRRCALATASLTRAGRRGEVVRSGEGGPDECAELPGDGNAACLSSDWRSTSLFSLAPGAPRAACFIAVP